MYPRSNLTWTCKKLTLFIVLQRFCLISAMQLGVKSEIYVPPDVSKMSCDARKWYEQGVSNAKRDLSGFEQISTGIKESQNINAALKTQLGSVLRQAIEVNDNTIELVPKLKGLINNIAYWAADPSWLDKIKLKAVISYVDGKRDNKSYYLLNGAALWCKLRVDKYLAPISSFNEAEKLIQDMNTFESKILEARDTLDNAAQEYVEGMNQLVQLVGDIGKNGKEIRAVVGKMKEGMDDKSENILQTSEISVDTIQSYIQSL